MVQPLFCLLVCCCCFGGGRKVAFGTTHCVTSTDSTAMREKDVFNIMSWCINSVHNITSTVIVWVQFTIREIAKCWWWYWLTEKVCLFVVVYLHRFCPSCTYGWTSMKEKVILGKKRSVLLFLIFFFLFSYFVFCVPFFGLISWGLLLFYCNLLACVVTLIFVR